MKYVFLCLCLAGCVTTTFTPGVQGGGGDVLFEYPKGQYTNLGLVDVGYYRPGWTAPTLTDALPKVREQVHALGGNAFIIRGQRPGQVASRSIIVSAEVLRVP
jgi:hypothetical protein